MNANELRIGNIVESLHTNGSPDEWVEIVVNADHIKTCVEHPEWFRGVVLTEERAIRLGFEKMDADINVQRWYNRTLKLWINSYQSEPNNYWLRHYQGASAQKLKFAHQLQNLYFALTGSELQMKAEG